MNRLKRIILVGAIAWSVFILSGCLPTMQTWNALPGNAASQIARQVTCRGEMLLIPMLLSGGKQVMLLGDPLPIHYPFEELKNKSFNGHQVGLVSVTWGVGSTRAIVAFLLLASDGTVYYLDVEDMPDDPATDICFYRAVLSPAWVRELQAMYLPQWMVTPGVFWPCCSFGGLSRRECRWEHPETSIPLAKAFLEKYPLRTTEEKQWRWQRFWKPCFTPNVYCEKGLHTLPEFTANEVLYCRDQIKKKIYVHPYTKERKEFDERWLELQTGESSPYFDTIYSMVKKAMKSGKYKVVVYQPEIHENKREEVDPERARNLYSFMVRRLAAKYNLPLVIVSPLEPDSAAPVYPGIPTGLRQYWHCPECARENMGL